VARQAIVLAIFAGAAKGGLARKLSVAATHGMGAPVLKVRAA